jgi:hypothetical protein
MKRIIIKPHSKFNLRQTLRKAINKQPLLCHKTPPLCVGCEPGETFKCSECSRLMPWCRGASDDMPDACDECWAKNH